ncbi:MAG: hypothetical protein AAGA53_17725 [Pseudomonadota bacterium]
MTNFDPQFIDLSPSDNTVSVNFNGELVVNFGNGEQWIVPNSGLFNVDVQHPNYHNYTLRSVVGIHTGGTLSAENEALIQIMAFQGNSLGETTLDAAFHATRLYPAPRPIEDFFETPDPVRTGDVSQVLGMNADSVLGGALNLPSSGPVFHIVNDDDRIIANVTAGEQHLLHPGMIIRHVYAEDGLIYVETLGIGVGILPEFNTLAAQFVWPTLPDSNILGHIHENPNQTIPADTRPPNGIPEEFVLPIAAGLTEANINTDLSEALATVANAFEEFVANSANINNANIIHNFLNDLSDFPEVAVRSIVAAQAVHGTGNGITSGVGYDFRFDQVLSDFEDNDIIGGGIDDLGSVFTITAGELRDDVAAATALGIPGLDEDAVVRGALNGAADQNGPELVVNLRGEESVGDARFGSNQFDFAGMDLDVLPEVLFDPDAPGFFGGFTFNDLNSIGIENTFAFNINNDAFDLPTLSFTDQFTTQGGGFNFEDTFLGSALTAGFDAANLASIGIGNGFSGIDFSTNSAFTGFSEWNPTDHFGFSANDVFGGLNFDLFSTATSQGYGLNTLNNVGFFSDSGQFFAPETFNTNTFDLGFGFNDFSFDLSSSFGGGFSQSSYYDPLYGNSYNYNRIDTAFGASSSSYLNIDYGFSSFNSSFIFPVVIDLDGDGIELDHLADAFFDFDGDGYVEQTTWASADDGFLAIDLNEDGSFGAGDGKIDQARELAFSLFDENAATDLQALAEARDEHGALLFDSNGDGVLSSADTLWNSFYIWQDEDRDGISDAGELKTLDELGITELGLSYDDGTEFGDSRNDTTLFGNTLYGAGSYVRNGETVRGAVGDVSLAYSNNGWRRIETEHGFRVEFETTGREIDYAELDGFGATDVNLTALGLDGATGDSRANVLTASGFATAVVLSGGAGNDILTGSENDDLLSGGEGADTIFAGAGDDALFIDHLDIDIDGGAGNDIAVVTSNTGVNLELASKSIEVVYGNVGHDTLDARGSAEGVTLHGGEGIDTLRGGDHEDILSGDESNDGLYGNGGNDILFGGIGNDLLVAGSGDDVLFGGVGDDTLFGGIGDDVFVYSRGDGADTVEDDGNIPVVQNIFADVRLVAPNNFGGTSTLDIPNVNITICGLIVCP